MHIAPILIQPVRKHQLEQLYNYVFQDASQPNAVASPTLCSACVCGTFSLYINQQPKLKNPTMTATIPDPGSGEVPSGDGNCDCGDGKYTLKIKPLKVHYDSMPRRQIDNDSIT